MSLSTMLQNAHHQLPAPMNQIMSWILLEDVVDADYYLVITCILLLILAFVQLRAFARPPPVPLKKLPRRPAIQILFKPDDIASVPVKSTQQTTVSDETGRSRGTRPSMFMRSISESFFRSGSQGSAPMDTTDASLSEGGAKADLFHAEKVISPDEDEEDGIGQEAEPPFLHSHNLPDSFAPLLSSSQMEILRHQMTADLIHAVHAKGGVRIREGRHEIPLDKDKSRPQLLLEVPKGGCKVAIAASVGSDGLSTNEDMDVTRPTESRSKPMVKHAGLVLDPPLPLANVAPTLIHFPTLFEDKFVPTLRRIQIVRFALDLVVSLSSFIEKVLWIIESKCQIHLSTVKVTPLYKGSSENNAPEWRLALAFSGHLLLFDWIPIPFISVRLPTFIIPHPHALLDRLLTAQPLASAKLRHENIAEKRLALAGIDILEGWNMDIKAVATPPALGVDVTMSGGVAVAVEMMHGRDAGAGTRRQDTESFIPPPAEPESVSGQSMSSWTTNPDSIPTGQDRRRSTASAVSTVPPFDANELVPWFLEVSAKGTVNEERMTVHILKMSALHEDKRSFTQQKSNFTMSGSLAVWKADLLTAQKATVTSPGGLKRRRSNSFGHLVALAASSGESASVGAILLSLDETGGSSKAQRLLRMLQYDYAFDVWDDSQVDAVTLSIGASHPLLTGGTMVTTILESIYAFGAMTAREGSVLDPSEPARKRNILRHLPALDFTFGVQNIFIPTESMSYSDDGRTRCTPEMDSGRMKIRVVGGAYGHEISAGGRASPSRHKEDGTSPSHSSVIDGIKLIADFSVGSLSLSNDAKVTEFPELDIFEGARLVSLLSGALTGRISGHLRRQILPDSSTTTGPNVLNPLEAYEIDFSGSSLSFKIKEWSATLGHRRVIMPTESVVIVKVVESVVDMSMEGKTDCELSWDLNGLSPILQVTNVGESPATAFHENKRQTSLLIPPLRQGRLNFHVSAVGGIRLSKAETSREDREGLYDWKFFNAIVSPDEDSPERILKVIHDKRTMEKLLSVVELVNTELHKILSYVLTQVWRAKEIFDQEGVSDPGHVIPGHKMARLISLFLCGDDSQVDVIRPIIQEITSGDGLDVVKVKELLRRNLAVYDEWGPEIDRLVRWASVMFSATVPAAPYVEKAVPLSQIPDYSERFENIPSARQLYEQIHDKPQLPLDPNFSNLVSRVAPYMSFRQTEYLLQCRDSADWQPSDLRRLRYVYSVKKRVQDISESYGGLSFLPQSFLVSVFLGEATRASLRWARRDRKKRMEKQWRPTRENRKTSILPGLRRRSRMPRQSSNIVDELTEDFVVTPAGRVASQQNFAIIAENRPIEGRTVSSFSLAEELAVEYELGDSLLGPQDVAVLLQAGLTSAMKGSTVVQLNQRMLLDLMTSQPKSFAIAVLAEIGTPGGQGSPRSLTSALMALLELDQSAFTRANRLDMHALLESWLPGFKVPRREDYLAGGRWARQSFYEAIYGLAQSILEDAACYMALKSHIQRERRHVEDDPIPQPKEFAKRGSDTSLNDMRRSVTMKPSKLEEAVADAKEKIREADEIGLQLRDTLIEDENAAKLSPEFDAAIEAYRTAFAACALVLGLDKCSFQAQWFGDFYRRNYDALMVKSIYDNVIDDVDKVRDWMNALRRGNLNQAATNAGTSDEPNLVDDVPDAASSEFEKSDRKRPARQKRGIQDNLFSNPELVKEQVLIDAIIDAVFYYEADRERIRQDPLVRLLISNPPGNYHFTIVTAMGVITEGKKGRELEAAFRRIKEKRDVIAIRADTGTARSYDYNAAKIEVAIESAVKLKRPYGLLGYSQGCANALQTESLLLSGSPTQQQALVDPESGLVCRQLLFSAANGSIHGPAMDVKVQRLIALAEEFFKYQQGYFSRAFTSTVLELINQGMDSAGFQKFFGGAQSMLPEGCKAFWREAQQLAHIPTCSMRGVLEDHTLPESLEMVSNLLTKQSGSPLHDSQVHVYDAVGHPVYTINRNGRILKNCDIGEGAVQRTHHWSPLSDEVEFVRTQRDVERASFECAKDRHVFPWVDVNVRFGFIRYACGEDDKKEHTTGGETDDTEVTSGMD